MTKDELNHRGINFTSRNCVIVESHEFVDNNECDTESLTSKNDLVADGFLE